LHILEINKFIFKKQLETRKEIIFEDKGQETQRSLHIDQHLEMKAVTFGARYTPPPPQAFQENSGLEVKVSFPNQGLYKQ
jgi:hypothetical protein